MTCKLVPDQGQGQMQGLRKTHMHEQTQQEEGVIMNQLFYLMPSETLSKHFDIVASSL